jgi:hypothetical protein
MTWVELNDGGDMGKRDEFSVFSFQFSVFRL